MHHARALFILLTITAWTLALLPAQLTALALRSRLASLLPQLYHRGNCAILGITLETVGAKVDARPALFAANHTSWLDIVVLSAVIPGSFVAKREVANWPIAGQLAKLQRSVFVERLRHRAGDYRDAMLARHEAGDYLILFPEGTSSDGNRVLPFKSSFFAVAEKPIGGKALVVQPVSVVYTRLNNMPVGRRLRPIFSWYGDMTLLPHLWRLFGVGPATSVIEFHEPVSIELLSSRKAMAAHCHACVSAGVSRAVRGRSPVPDEAPLEGRPSPRNLDSWGANASVSG